MRRTAEQAAVPRSYLNQFERGRWIPTDEFLAKLAAFYANHGIFNPTEPEQWAVEPPEPDPVAWDNPGDDSLGDPDAATDTLDPDVASKSGWRAIAKSVLVLGLVGGLLMASGNLPSALEVIRRMPRRRQSRFPR